MNSEAYEKYISFLKKYCIKHRFSLLEANKHLVCIIVAKEYGIANTEEETLLKRLEREQCSNVYKYIERPKTFQQNVCLGLYTGTCSWALCGRR